MLEDDEDQFASVEYLQEGDVILDEREGKQQV
jgi:hypothetical protein